MVLKRGWNNWKLEANLLAILTVAVSIIACIPIFTDGSLQFGLMKSLGEYEKNSGIPAGVIIMNCSTKESDITAAVHSEVTEFLRKEAPVLIDLRLIRHQFHGVLDRKLKRPTSAKLRYGRMMFLSNFTDMINVIDGRLPEDNTSEEIEVMVSEKCLNDFELLMGNNYPFKISEHITFTVKVVGVFKLKDKYRGSHELAIHNFNEEFIVNKGTWLDLLDMDDINASWLSWHWYFDYKDLQFHRMPALYKGLQTLEARAARILPGISISTSPRHVLADYYQQSRILSSLLFSLSLPILGILFYYIVLIVQLMIARRRTEIALLQSRGAGKLQICASYVIELGLLGIIALIAGSNIGNFFARVFGASKGFLSFVGRDPLPVRMFKDPYIFAICLVAVTIAVTLIPVFSAAGQSIVNYKQESSRKHKKPLWQKIPIDFLLIGFAVYGYFSLKMRAAGGELMQNVILDSSLFLFPVILILGSGLLTLRVFPFLIKLIDLLTQKRCSVSWDMTMKLLSRSPEQYNPLIVLIILTLALGIYSSATARTMDRNFIDSELYRSGADVILHEKWIESKSPANEPGPEEEYENIETPRIYEPPFYIHTKLEGVESAARVMNLRDAVVKNAAMDNMHLMAIDPHEFYDTSWFREDLLAYPFHEYLNLLIQRPSGIIIDENHAREAGLISGDMLSIEIQHVSVEFIILGTVRYWPTLYADKGAFGIANLQFLQSMLPITPYSVWLKLTPDADLQEIVNTLRKEGIYVLRLEDTRRRIIQGIRSPQRTGLYGMLSMGFLVASLITIMGFLLYTFLSLKKRMLQFGILRAIGLKVRQVMAMLMYEFLFTVGTGLLIGTILGENVSSLFLPLLRTSATAQEDVPPFLVVIEWSDKAKIYAVLGTAFIIGIIGLQIIISKLKINQAVKLGEDL